MSALLALDLGDGRELVSDRPPARVQEAAARARAAMTERRPPELADIRRVLLWLEEQDRRHGGVRKR